jgi:hypothetical protein
MKNSVFWAVKVLGCRHYNRRSSFLSPIVKLTGFAAFMFTYPNQIPLSSVPDHDILVWIRILAIFVIFLLITL